MWEAGHDTGRVYIHLLIALIHDFGSFDRTIVHVSAAFFSLHPAIAIAMLFKMQAAYENGLNAVVKCSIA
jgi:hypothetical protein